jgi:hypothetical protein
VDFEEALANYVKLAQARTKERTYSDGKAITLTTSPRRSKRYVRVYEKSEGCVFAFIDISNGDVLYPASWSKPAKHARGNIFADDPLEGTGPYGPEQLPNWRKDA